MNINGYLSLSFFHVVKNFAALAITLLCKSLFCGSVSFIADHRAVSRQTERQLFI